MPHVGAGTQAATVTRSGHDRPPLCRICVCCGRICVSGARSMLGEVDPRRRTSILSLPPPLEGGARRVKEELEGEAAPPNPCARIPPPPSPCATSLLVPRPRVRPPPSSWPCTRSPPLPPPPREASVAVMLGKGGRAGAPRRERKWGCSGINLRKGERVCRAAWGGRGLRERREREWMRENETLTPVYIQWMWYRAEMGCLLDQYFSRRALYCAHLR